MNIKEKIEKTIQNILKEMGLDQRVSLEIPADSLHGDYTTNIAFVLAKQLKKTPMQVAEEIKQKLLIHQGKWKIDVVKPGFINFWIPQQELFKNLQEICVAPEKVGKSDLGRGKKVVIEYSSPNIAKPFTVGHLRSTIIGDAIANLLQAVGYEVFRDNHIGDWGTQFGKQIYAIKTWGNESEIEKSDKPVRLLVDLYVKFHNEAEKNPDIEGEGRKWFKKLEDGDLEARRLWEKCIAWSWKEFKQIYHILGVSFTENNGTGYGEAFFEGKMQPVIAELGGKGLLKEDNGAQLVFFPHDEYPPLMIVKKDGATLYATRDLATDKFRLEHYGNDVFVINEVGSEQTLYFKQLYRTEELLGWFRKGQRMHVGHGLINFKDGKMSTRKGNTIWLEEVLWEAEKRATMLGEDNIENPMRVAIGALKWNDLKRSPHVDIIFDWDEILSMQGNSGPYVQYAYTRTYSIREKAKGLGLREDVISTYSPYDQENILMRKLFNFSQVVEKAATGYSPQILCTYLFDLAQNFNLFYQKYRILDAGSHLEKSFRLALVRAVGVVLKEGLSLLGIAAPEHM